jgi:hypothetical protein
VEPAGPPPMTTTSWSKRFLCVISDDTWPVD